VRLGSSGGTFDPRPLSCHAELGMDRSLLIPFRYRSMSWSSSSPVLLGVSAVTLMVGIAAAWYALAVFALTTAMVRSAFHRVLRWIDRIAGIAIMGFGAKLALDR